MRLRLHRQSRARRGLSLLEVLAALTIFLLSLVAISQLMNGSTRRAREIELQSQGTLLCASKLGEFVAGVESVEAGGEGEFEEDPSWRWSAESVAESSAPGLYRVTVRVSRSGTTGGAGGEVSLSQMILSPTMRGNLSLSSPAASSNSSSSTTPATSGGSTTPATSSSTPTTGTGR